jgi:hypothetical protein
MILAALAWAALSADEDAEQFKSEPVEPRAAIRTFVDACWRGLRKPEIFDAAVAAMPATSETPEQYDARVITNSQFELYYVPGRTCHAKFRVSSEAETVQTADQLAERLGVQKTKRYYATDLIPSLALWHFRNVPIDDKYYALWVYARDPRFDAPGPYRMEITVSYGAAR